MCGRFSLAVSEKKLQRELPFVELGANVKPSYNIAPTQHAYVVTNEAPPVLQYLTWGLVPFWSKDGKNQGKLINARAEGIASKPSFRIPIRRQRCLVLADSFYEWRKEGQQKIPYRLLPADDKLLVMAGIWDVWDQEGYPIKSFSIITTTPNREVSSIHNRMPVVLPDLERQQHWLEALPTPEILEMLQPVADGFFKVYKISSDVNKPVHNAAYLHDPIPENLDLFSQR
ncbi:MAG: SOS response-associated peptidase [Phaeodactylibacter sp.]|nr:SOS response-associated peptidase [Phaeodactylibacter sp.]